MTMDRLTIRENLSAVFDFKEGHKSSWTSRIGTGSFCEHFCVGDRFFLYNNVVSIAVIKG